MIGPRGARTRGVSVGDRVTIAKNLPATPWVEANGLERAVITGDHRKAGAAGTVEYLTRGLKGAFSVKVRHDDGNLAPYLVNELDGVCAMAAPADSSDWLSWAVEVWNRRVPVGAPVALTEDDGSITNTATRSEAWQLGDGTPVVKVDGRTGGYLLRRIRPIGRVQDRIDRETGLIQRMRDCLLELAGEPEESETIPELIQRARETIRRPDTCFKNRPLSNCAAAPGGDCDGCDEHKPSGPGQRGAEIRRQAKRGVIAEQLWQACDAWERAMPSKHVREDRPALVRASQALVAIIQQIRRSANPELFARTGQDSARRWYERAEELRAELEADRSALAELLREVDPDWHPDGTSMIDHLRRLLARTETDIAQVVGRLVALEAAVFDAPGVCRTERLAFNDFAIALGVEKWEQPGELVVATESLVATHHNLVRSIAEMATTIAGVLATPARDWRKKSLYNHLQAVQHDLLRAVGLAVGLAEKGGAGCPD